MGNYEQLKQAVADVIKSNGDQEITGAILQNALFWLFLQVCLLRSAVLVPPLRLV